MLDLLGLSCDDQVLPLGTDFTRFPINIEAGELSRSLARDHFCLCRFSSREH